MSSRRRRDLPRAIHPAAGRENARYRTNEVHSVRAVQRLLPASIEGIVPHIIRQPSLFHSSHLCLLAPSHFVHFYRCVRVTSPVNEYAIRACGPFVSPSTISVPARMSYTVYTSSIKVKLNFSYVFFSKTPSLYRLILRERIIIGPEILLASSSGVTRVGVTRGGN